jgi:hypothetical protein
VPRRASSRREWDSTGKRPGRDEIHEAGPSQVIQQELYPIRRIKTSIPIDKDASLPLGQNSQQSQRAHARHYSHKQHYHILSDFHDHARFPCLAQKVSHISSRHPLNLFSTGSSLRLAPRFNNGSLVAHGRTPVTGVEMTQVTKLGRQARQGRERNPAPYFCNWRGLTWPAIIT